MSNSAIEWLRAAYSDIVVMDSIVDNDLVTHMTAFHSQQCIEKSFKAILEFYNKKVPRKHDVLLINELVSEYIVIENEDILDKINALYIDSRYPGDMGLLPDGKPTLEQAQEFYEFAKDIFYRVCKLLEIDLEEVKK